MSTQANPAQDRPSDPSSDPALDQAQQARIQKAEEIAGAPGNYKICEGCESIVTARVVTCPNCHGYRFDETPEAVVSQARLLGQRARRSVIAEDLI